MVIMAKGVDIGAVCVKCQRCCKKIAVPTLLSWDQYNREFYATRNVKLFRLPNDSTGIVWAEWDWPCPQLTAKGCAIYDKRPAVCVAYFPKRSEGDMFKECELAKMGVII